MCGTASVWAKLSFVAILLSFIFFVVGFATMAWMLYSFNGATTRIGLWKAQGCSSDGSCVSVSTPDSYKNDSFRATQAMEVMALIVILVTPFMIGAYVFFENVRSWNLAVVCMVACFLFAIFVTIGMIIWLTYIFSPFVASWSMGMTIIGGILAVVAGLLLIPEVEDRDDYYDDDDNYKDDRNDYSSWNKRNNRYQTTSFIGDRTYFNIDKDNSTPSNPSLSASLNDSYDRRPSPASSKDFKGLRTTFPREYSMDVPDSPVPRPYLSDTRRPRRSRSVSPFIVDKPPPVRLAGTPEIERRAETPKSPNIINQKKIYDSKPSPAVPEWSRKSPYNSDFNSNVDHIPANFSAPTYNNVSDIKLQRDQA